MNEITYLTEQVRLAVPDLSEEQAAQLYTYYQRLVEKNQVMNLTAITEFTEVVRKHFIDSLMLFQAVDREILQTPLNVLDLGTGAGFPGIPLKIAYPALNVVLVDSLNKRVKFLQEVIDELGLKGITAIHGRAEDVGRDPMYREKMDLVVSRAVANLATLSEYCLPLVKLGGAFIPYKSGAVNEEAADAKKAIYLCAGKLEEIIPYELPGETGAEVMGRSLIVIRKTGPISKKYPRNPGKPAKEPLR
ncbi:MAG: 16S rRNA (guanine(527)-N(7))-methyltransferase RsmG [Lachnospiraceae bacterium]|nr:16S rRNA (guanine(527)-N(7))-methyltransferase RsmG [Lachnospiraceae bacterium]